ncbi:MAG: YbhB/YbcL family Raf kinase inhibitor-like protein [Deltaproteobacteria bacterium]|nr:YbhB/YbcL family Raf kinase inhibitor-like protein [Deltaproteobacteria bacterium]
MNKDLAGFLLVPALFICGLSHAAWADERGGGTMELRSNAFTQGAMIPSAYTCDGKDVSPPLAWTGLQAGTRSIALICDDPDAPAGTWVHWVYYDIPPGTQELDEDVDPVEYPSSGGTQGKNDFRKTGYGGPCPPSGTHRYFFKLYALDSELSLPPGRTKKELLDAMKGHIIGQAELMGKYERK